MFDTIIKNWGRLCEENPDITEAINAGYEVAAYDEQTKMIISVELVEGTLKMKVVEDTYVIKNQEENKNV